MFHANVRVETLLLFFVLPTDNGGMEIIMYHIIEIVISLFALFFTIGQFFYIRFLKKREKELLMRSNFFYLETILSTTIYQIPRLLDDWDSISKKDIQNIAATHVLDSEVLNIVSNLAELSFGFFCGMKRNRNITQKVQMFLGFVIETINTTNGMLSVISSGNISDIDIYRRKTGEMSIRLKEEFDKYRNIINNKSNIT